MSGVFEQWAPTYRALGFEPRPIQPGGKACKLQGWQKPDPELGPEKLQGWLKKHADHGIGLRLGTALPNGSKLGVLDIDRGDAVRLARVLLGPTCERFGSKGMAFFFQYAGDIRRAQLKRRQEEKGSAAIGELLVESCLCVIPPTVHPVTARPYEWASASLPDFDLAALMPLASPRQVAGLNSPTARSVELLLAALQSRHTATLASGQETHDAALGFVNELLPHSQDEGFIQSLVEAVLPASYRGNTLGEVPEMVRSGIAKGMHLAGEPPQVSYQPGEVGPLPLGYLPDGSFVLFDQIKRIVVPATSNALISVGSLLNFAPATFWKSTFPAFGDGPVRINSLAAGDAIMGACRARGGFDASLVRGRGVYRDPRGGVIVNWGDNVPDDTKYVYVCHRPLELREEGDPVDAIAILALFTLFNWNSPSDPLLLLGWAASSVVCGVLPWRPHLFLTGAKNTGKTTLIHALQSLLDPVAIVLDGQSTEAGIRQKVGADSRPVILDEFESDSNTGRMRQVIKLMRSASSADNTVARGTPEGRALEFSIRSSFLLAAINPIAVTAADRSRILVLSLNKHQSDRAVQEQIARGIEALQERGPAWCRSVLGRVDWVLANSATLFRVFPPADNRHQRNIATLLGAAQAVLLDHPLSEDEARTLLAEHADAIDQLGVAHEHDDSIECWSAILEYRVRFTEADEMLGTLLGWAKAAQVRRRRGAPDDIPLARELANYGLKWADGGVVVANSHRGLAEVFKETLWETGNWGPALKRLEGATRTKQKRFGGVRSEGTWVPGALVPDLEQAEPEY